MRIKINKITKEMIGKELTVKGWVRSVRDQKAFAFIIINDGSSVEGIQVVMNSDLPSFQEILAKLNTGASVAIEGTIVASPGTQEFELKASKIEIIGECPEDYPLQKKRHTFEYLRTIAHLRPRTNTFGAVARVRHAMAMATHKFFDEKGFKYVHTPVITASDCEGAGEQFQVIIEPAKKDPSKEFFGKPTFLTVSGQLEGETYACAISDIYTFGPTFRAENSNTPRHLAEFWMIEPEMAFADLKDDMVCAESYIKFCVAYALEHCKKDLEFFDQHIEKGLIERLKHVLTSDFARVPYTEAVEILQKSGKKFDYPVEWGNDLQTEHEKYLVDIHFKKPTIVYNYPKSLKPFYMHVNDDGKTVAAMDVLVSGVGEIIGGSQRESRLDILEERMKAQGLDPQDLWWYSDLRRYGTVPHAGFGLGFERLIQFVTGMENIRDVIPFPRTPGHAEF
ncbi:MAG: Asparagine-tRNA ligase [candidate division TM6 bacterium GW2011_GWF2_32_72]|nr:MAG: Asparagine-tRNA ligase [candidate division TM6 bacterium GW2011_GWF2_32_72]